MLAEQHDEWTESRRYLVLELIQQAQTVGEPAADVAQAKEGTDPDLVLSA